MFYNLPLIVTNAVPPEHEVKSESWPVVKVIVLPDVEYPGKEIIAVPPLTATSSV